MGVPPHVNLTAGNTSYLWLIVKVPAQSDLVTFDGGLNESYVELFEEAKTLSINYNTCI